MPRTARIVIAGLAHHVTQRGNNRQDVFFVDEDRKTYLALLREQCGRFGVRVLGYCLMANHVHVVAVPRAADSLAKAVGRTHFLYAQYINRMHGRSGHLWQNRFYSCPLDGTHQWNALCYVERNPVRARLVRVAWRYRWSSAAAHTDGRDGSGLLDLEAWARDWGGRRWHRELARPEDRAWTARIRRNTHTGRPLATDSFLSRLERRLGRRLRPLPVGRPRKRPKSARRRKK